MSRRYTLRKTSTGIITFEPTKVGKFTRSVLTKQRICFDDLDEATATAKVPDIYKTTATEFQPMPTPMTISAGYIMPKLTNIKTYYSVYKREKVYCVLKANEGIAIYRMANIQNKSKSVVEQRLQLHPVKTLPRYEKIVVGGLPHLATHAYYSTAGWEIGDNAYYIQLLNRKILVVSDLIYELELEEGDKFEHFYSPTQKSTGITFPYIVGARNVYLVAEAVKIPRKSVYMTTDPYMQLYGKIDSHIWGKLKYGLPYKLTASNRKGVLARFHDSTVKLFK